VAVWAAIRWKVVFHVPMKGACGVDCGGHSECRVGDAAVVCGFRAGRGNGGSAGDLGGSEQGRKDGCSLLCKSALQA